MLKKTLLSYLDDVSDYMDIGVVIRPIDTCCDVIAVSYDVTADISEYGELLICVSIETKPFGNLFPMHFS